MDYSGIVFAVLQGLFEWWPISSSGVILLVSILFGFRVVTGYTIGLMLHLGSGLAVFTLYWRWFRDLIVKTIHLRFDREVKGYYMGLITSLIIGYILYSVFVEVSAIYGILVLFILSLGLIITSILLARGGRGTRSDISLIDWLIMGVMQGIAVLPGFSRSGLTIGYLSVRRYKPYTCIRASLLLGGPALLLAGLYNAILNYDLYPITDMMIQLVIVFAISILSAKILIEVARRMKFHYFTLLFAVLIIVGAIIQLIVSG